MAFSIQAIPRGARRRLKRVAQKSKDSSQVRRALAILQLFEGKTVSAVARDVRAARSTVQSWRGLYEEYGEEGLSPTRAGRPASTVSEGLIAQLRVLLTRRPEDYGYLRSQWSSELLALVLKEQLGVAIHASTVRRLLPRIAYVWRRTRPTLTRRDPGRNRKLRAIERALHRRRGVEVFYVDEADVDFNPKLGSMWTPRGKQVGIPTPGQNQKHYLAGALHAHSGELVWVEHTRKTTALFIKLLEALVQTYRQARELVLILDNYSVHKSAGTQAWLQQHAKFRLVFQPTYSPWVNQIERLWKVMHDTVTRNHRCETFDELCRRVARLLEVVQPFPGNGHGLAKL
jgi:transposase